jgi:hypothetical protein
MKSNLFAVCGIAVMLLIGASCKKKERSGTTRDPENEFITTVRIVASNTMDTADVVTAQCRDLTPENGDADLSKAYMTLRAQATYSVEVTFLDETQSPVKDVTYTIKDRADYHLVCYAHDALLNLSVARTDHDNNMPQQELGLSSTFTTGAASSGELEIALHHQVIEKTGDCRKGTTDAEVSFAVTVE